MKLTTQLLQSLGFTISEKKSVFQPSTTIQFLGFVIDSQKMMVTLGEGKATEIKTLLSEALHLRSMTIRHFAMILGKTGCHSTGKQIWPVIPQTTRNVQDGKSETH